MGILDLFKHPNINEGINEYQNTPQALLIDVRSKGEYQQGHIPGSQNIPLKNIEDIGSYAKEKSAVIFIYCQSGGRSRQAAKALRQMGYSNVKDIGGISGYSGPVEH